MMNVQVVGRFVQQDFRWGLGQRAGNVHPLALSAGEAQPALVAFIQHIHALQCRRDGLVIVRAPVGKSGVVRNSSKFHHVANAHVGVGHPVLLNERYPAGKLLFGDAGDVLPVQRHAARIRATQSREDTQKRRFSAAVWAQQADGFPPGDLQRDVIDDRLFADLPGNIFSADTHHLFLER